MEKIFTWVMAFLATMGLCMTTVSCEPEGLVDTSEFTLYYPGISDIGPSTNFNITPTYHGAAPSEFFVEGVTLEGSEVSKDNFVVNSEDGTFSLVDTENLAVGLYKITISCKSGGKRYSFRDIITVNMMKAVPDGITVEPDFLSVNIKQITEPKEGEELPTAQISTDGTSVTIKKYLLSTVTRDDVIVDNADELFIVDETTGKVSIAENPAFLPGKYVLDFKLTTYLVNEQSEEGIFADALTIDITSEPYLLTYTPAEVYVDPGFSAESLAPVMAGTQEEVVYSIKSVMKNDAEEVTDASFRIDAATGVISVDKDHKLAANDSYSITVNVKNKYGSKDFKDAFKVIVVESIAAITEFAYNDFSTFCNSGFSIEPSQNSGEHVTYSFVDLPEACSTLVLDSATGEITADKTNGIPEGKYTITVHAENNKSEKTASFVLEVVYNPNMFSFVHYGNNLDLAPAADYASQYRFSKSADLTAATIAVADSDIPEGVPVNYEIDFTNSIIDANAANAEKAKAAIAIDAATGNLTFKADAFGKNRVMMLLVKVTTGDDPKSQVSVKVPVFIHTEDALKPEGYTGDGIYVHYTPFVFQVNPVNGGTSPAPEILGLTDAVNFRLEYRQDFVYANINGPESHKSGVRQDKGSFIRYMWDAFYEKIGKKPNYGQKYPLSFYQGIKDGWLNTYALGYVNTYEPSKNPTGQYEIRMNPNVWKDDQGVFANGAMIGKIAYSVDGSEPDKQRIIPVAVWFDEKF